MNLRKLLVPLLLTTNIAVLTLSVIILRNVSCNTDQGPTVRPSILYAPWRDNYNGNSAAHKKRKLSCDCVFCHMYATPAEDDFYLVVHRLAHCFVILNKYPYSLGHILIVARHHHGHYLDFPSEAHHEIADVLALTMRALNTVLKPDGINTGYNVGRAAGASIPGHLHMHIVPRWHGYGNFMDKLTTTCIIDRDMQRIYKEFYDAFHHELETSPLPLAHRHHIK